MFIELYMDNGFIVLNTMHIVSLHADEDLSEPVSEAFGKYTNTVVYIKTIDGLTHTNSFFHLEEEQSYADADWFYNKIKKMLNVTPEID
tara:strand:+ start:729 stop:995 length:267 start_codon:yes stop_codon:yes gene_type:complete